MFWQHGILSSMKTAGVCAVLVAEGDMDHFTSELFIAVMCPAMILALLSAC